MLPSLDRMLVAMAWDQPRVFDFLFAAGSIPFEPESLMRVMNLMKNVMTWIRTNLGRGCAFFSVCLAWAALTVVTVRAADQPTPALKGLIIVGSEQAVLKEGDAGLAVTGLQVKDVPMLAGKDFDGLMKKFFGRPIEQASFEKLSKEIQSTIVRYYRGKGFPLVDAIFPPQTVANGVLQILVVESKLGKVIIEGTNGWTQAAYLRKNLHVAEGGAVDERELLSDLNWLNRNRFRSVDVFFQPGAAKLESDLVVRTKERPPFGGSVGFDNGGTRLSGENRVFAGVEWGKAFGLNDNLLTYRYTSDADFEFLTAHSVSYSIPFPWHHTLRFSGAYSSVIGNIPSSPVTQEGTSYLANLRYEMGLPNVGDYRHVLTIGGDFRQMDNNLEFNLANIFSETTEVIQPSVGYSGVLPDPWGSTFFGAEIYYSPGGLTDRNSDAAFNKSFPLAQSDYAYATLTLERATRLPLGMTWRLSGTYQLADGNLLPSEQMGLGGSYTVRGYEERTVSGSEGFMVINELRFPSFSVGRLFDKSAKDELQFLGFFDYGETSNPDLQPREDPHMLLSSVGLGLRYRVSRFLTAHADYGWQLTDPGRGGAATQDNSRGHVFVEFKY